MHTTKCKREKEDEQVLTVIEPVVMRVENCPFLRARKVLNRTLGSSFVSPP
jgi:hypothetical protein